MELTKKNWFNTEVRKKASRSANGSGEYLKSVENHKTENCSGVYRHLFVILQFILFIDRICRISFESKFNDPVTVKKVSF